jgi:hypothetical protein
LLGAARIFAPPVLAPSFVEWLMGLEEGFVTDLGLPELSPCGSSATAS